MATDVLAEILEWSKERPAWQRDALRRLFSSGTTDDGDLDELVEICKATHGLTEQPATEPLDKQHLAINDTKLEPVSLRSVTHHRGVNSLAPEQTISFEAGLTIVFGRNASGKSGYTRILKAACRSRAAEEILGNVLANEAPVNGQATIQYRVGKAEKKASWSPDGQPDRSLAAVSVFDAHCAPVYLGEKTDVAFRPFGLDVFDKLSRACAQLRRRLELEYNALFNASPALPQVETGTKVATLLAGLTARTKPAAVEKLASLSEAETERLEALHAKKRDFEAGDPQKRSALLDLRAGRVELVADHAAALFGLLGREAMTTLCTDHQNVAKMADALAKLRERVLTPGLLTGTGEEAWRALWDAARAFSDVPYPDDEFPVAGEGRQCLLCQQPVGKDAATRFKHFQELVSSSAQASLRKAESIYATKLEALSRAVVQRDDVTLALDEIETDDEALAQSARTFCLEAATVQEAAQDAAKSREAPPESGVQKSPEAKLRTAATNLRARASELRENGGSMDPKEVQEFNELEARVVLSEHLQMVLDEIDRKSSLSAYRDCMEETNTQQITKKSTELTKRLVTKRLRDTFKEELKKVKFTHLAAEIKPAGGSKGAFRHQLVFSNAPGVTVPDVLSEGEARTLSLAAFLTELSTASVPSAIIFDDPVSSLDHIWRERIAGRLALEARSRQVIVFTHDLLFLKCLMDECDNAAVALHHQHVRREGTSAGLCSPDLEWIAMPVKKRIGVLKNRCQAAKKRLKSDGQQAYEREAREIYGYLRQAWEDALGEKLLNGVIERYRPSIETKRARCLHDIEEIDYEELEAGMKECSRWILGHSEAAADGTPIPDPDEVTKRVLDLEAWVKRIADRRK